MNSLKEGAMWHIEPSLGKDLETNETTTVAIQQCSKHASTTVELLLEMVFSTWSVQRGYKEDNLGD
jgi:membrane-anchored protein YejM (alkaline phosphatase superfamily)